MMRWNRWGMAAGLAAALAFAGQARAQGAGGTGASTGSGQSGSTTGSERGSSGSSGSMGSGSGATGSGSMGSGAGHMGSSSGHMGSDAAAGSTGSSASAQGSAKVSKDLEDGLQKLHAANLSEVQMGELGVQHAQNERVKEFAQRMVDDHRKADEQLTQTSQQMGIDLNGSAFQKEQTRSQKRLDKLTSKTGAGFDKAYMADMVEDHRKDTREVGTLAKKARQGQHQELAAFLEQTHSTLQGHLKEAQQTQKALGASRQARKPRGSSMGTGSSGSSTTGSGSGSSGSTDTGSGGAAGSGSGSGAGGGGGH